MSLTSYRAAPPRDKPCSVRQGRFRTNVSADLGVGQRRSSANEARDAKKGLLREELALWHGEWVITLAQSACYNAWRRPTLPTLER